MKNIIENIAFLLVIIYLSIFIIIFKIFNIKIDE